MGTWTVRGEPEWSIRVFEHEEPKEDQGHPTPII